jgi:hypothetical protein
MPGDLISADKIIGKTLIAAKNIPVFLNKPVKNKAKSIGIIKTGNSCGVVYSWTQDSDGTILWMFRGGNGIADGSYYYVQHRQGNFNISDLRQQGIITTQEGILKAAEEQKKSEETVLDKASNALSTIGGGIQKIAIIGLVIWGVTRIFESTNKR